MRRGSSLICPPIVFFFFFFFWLLSMRDLSFPTKDQARIPCSGSAES